MTGGSSEPDRSGVILFVTGRLAEAGLSEVVRSLSQKVGFDWEIQVPGIQVAALMHTRLLRQRLRPSGRIRRVIVPGWCQGNLNELTQHFGIPFERGPKDYRDLPGFFGLESGGRADLNDHDMQIIAEINHATRLRLEEILIQAQVLADAGADIIDVGCVPGESSGRVSEIVQALKERSFRVSIDSFDPSEVRQAVQAGAELILSCRVSDVGWMADLGVEVVAIPETPEDTASLDQVADELTRRGVPFRADPIIEPVGMGFLRSLQRYVDFRQRHPQVAMMMGVGNVTELAEVDSAGVNLLLAAVCQELRIGSVLTTQVASWCRTAVAELDAARRLVCHAVRRHIPAKHLDDSLVMLRDARVRMESDAALRALAAALKDPAYRIFSRPDGVHLMNRDGHWAGEDVFAVFAEALQNAATPVDAAHAFYLGYEMARAELARHLGKQYVQDGPLRWGLIGDWEPSTGAHARPMPGDQAPGERKPGEQKPEKDSRE